MALIDTHAHICDERYAEDLDEVLRRAREAGLTRLIIAAATMEESQKAICKAVEKTTDELPVWCMTGVHPHDADGFTDGDYTRLKEWLLDREKNRIVALGEIGLDFFYDLSQRDTQILVFQRQLELAFEADLPIVLHTRDATKDTLTILDDFKRNKMLRSVPGVCHCFSGSEETAEKLLQMGFYLGFDGPITFKNSKRAPYVISMTPPDRLLTETDSPYLTPVPYRGKRNEPSYVGLVLDKMAEIKGMDREEMAAVVTDNACRLFGI